MPRETVFIIDPKDAPDMGRLLDEFRAVGRTLRHPEKGEGPRGSRRGDRWGFGKANTALASGALTAPNNVVDKDKGPAWNAGSGATLSATIEADWNLDDTEIAVGEWVVWERKEGKVYVSRLYCPTV